MIQRIDTLRADMMARYVQTGGENGEPFTPPCTHESFAELSEVTDDIDHASFTAMCRGCGEFLSVIEWKTDRPNELTVLRGMQRYEAQRAWFAQLALEND